MLQKNPNQRININEVDEEIKIIDLKSKDFSKSFDIGHILLILIIVNLITSLGCW